MVKLSILSYRSNSNSRYFPHSGYLGLTPVKVEGVVRTTLDEDHKPLLASSVHASVRCIEARLGRVGVVHSNVLADYTQLLWSKPDGVEWAELGDAEFPFKIVIPTKTPGFTYANFQDYRVFWRIEAVIEHAPTFGVGSRKLKTYEIPLVRYDTHVPGADFVPSPARILTTRKPRAPVIQYQLLQPTSPIGPLDIVTVQLMLQPVDRSVTVRNASLVVERRIELSEARQLITRDRQDSLSRSPSPTSSPNPLYVSQSDRSSGFPPHATNHDRTRERRGMSEPATTSGGLLSPPPDAHFTSASLTSLSSTNTAYSAGSTADERPLLNHITTDLPAKTISLTVAHVDSAGAFIKDPSGAYTKSLTLQWPANKSNSHWAMGETMQTELIRVRFFIHVKIIVSSPSTGTESIELEERELLLISTNESDRKLAATKYADASARSKSKSPRRSKPPLSDSAENQLPSPLPIPPLPQSAIPLEGRSNFTSHHSSCSSPAATVPTPPPQVLRRPHTSAGPRDKQSSRSHHRHHEHHRERERNREDENPNKIPSVFRSSRRPETARPSTGSKDSVTSSPTSTYPYPPAHARRSSREVNGGAVIASGPDGVVNDPKTVRAWEEELARIERTSRRVSADMLGFNLKRLRMRATRPKTASSSLTSNSP